MYSRQPVIILDDVFSGLDATSEDRIFSRLLGKSGLLRRLGTTVILVTHAAHRLSYADNIIALSAKGTILEQGKFQNLMANNGYVAGLAARHTVEGEGIPKEEPAITKVPGDDETVRQNAAADLLRPVGNWAVYRYYIAGIGLRNTLVWMVLMIVYSVLLRFPGIFTPLVLRAYANNEKISGSSFGRVLPLFTATQSMVFTLESLLEWNSLPWPH